MTIDEYDYYCPKCSQKLSMDGHVVFDIKRLNNEAGKLYLDPKPGSYEFKCEPEMTFEAGELVDFYCPNCKGSLTSGKYEKFVEIGLKITDQVFIDVFFSRIYGMHKTYVGIEDFENEYGDQIRKH